MHEASITQSMLDLALEKAREAGAGKLTRINLVVGELAGVVPDCMQFYFDAIKMPTPAREAVLNFKMLPVKVKCRKCGREFTPAGASWDCPACGEISPDIISGRECFMESIEVE